MWITLSRWFAYRWRNRNKLTLQTDWSSVYCKFNCFSYAQITILVFFFSLFITQIYHCRGWSWGPCLSTLQTSSFSCVSVWLSLRNQPKATELPWFSNEQQFLNCNKTVQGQLLRSCLKNVLPRHNWIYRTRILLASGARLVFSHCVVQVTL